MKTTTTNNFDFVLNKMGYTHIPLIQRAVIFFKILHETGIPYRRYYTTHNKLRSGFSKDAIDVVTLAECDINYANYVIYLYNEKMKVIDRLNNMLAS